MRDLAEPRFSVRLVMVVLAMGLPPSCTNDGTTGQGSLGAGGGTVQAGGAKGTAQSTATSTGAALGATPTSGGTASVSVGGAVGTKTTGGAVGTGGTTQSTTNVATGGVIPTGGTAATGGKAATSGGSTAATGGKAATSGGTAATGGKAAASGGTAAASGGTTTASGGTTTASAGTTSAKGMTLYYIRHAQVVANTLDPSEITFENSEALTELGLQQISELTTYLVGMNVTPDAVLVSPTKRTQKTIEPYLVAQKITGTIWMELAECCTQTPSGGAIPTQPILAAYRATVEGQNLVFRDPNATKYWQNDTYEAGLLMVTTAKTDLLSQFSQSGKTIFVVGHASAGSVLLNLMRGVDVSAGTGATSSTALYLMNTGVQRLVQDPASGAFKLDGRNLNQPRTE